jgi:hypothetical protein
LLDIFRAFDICRTAFAMVNIFLDMEAILEVGQPPIGPFRLWLLAILGEKVPDFVCLLLENIARNYRFLLLHLLLPFKEY